MEKRSTHWHFYTNERAKAKGDLKYALIELDETLTLQCSRRDATVVHSQGIPVRQMTPRYCYDVFYEHKDALLSYLKARYIWEQK